MRSYSKKVCPVTHAPQNWSESKDGNLILVHDQHIHTSDEWKHIGDSELGSPMYIRVESGGNGEKNQYKTKTSYPEDKPAAGIADRDRVYRRLLELCPLTPAHRQHLEGRGVPNLTSILPFGSLPHGEKGNRWSILKGLLDAGFERDFLQTIPGFYREPSGHLVMSGPEGILVPVPDQQGRIQGFQIRRDKNDPDAPRYVWLSAGWIDEQTNERRGVKSGAPAGVLFPSAGNEWNGEVALTEGAIKGAALRAHVAPETAVIFAAGVAQIASIQTAIDSLPKKPTKATLFFDADAWRKSQVFAALAKQIATFEAQGLAVEVAVWAEEIGKGIDDFLSYEPPKPPDTKDGEKAKSAPILELPFDRRQTLGDVQIFPASGFQEAYKALLNNDPLHLFPSSLDAALALSFGLPAICVPMFLLDDKELDRLKERLEKHEASEVFIYAPMPHTKRGIDLARLLINRDLDVRLACDASGVSDYAALYEEEAESLALVEAKEAWAARSEPRLNVVLGRCKAALAGRSTLLVAQTIETIKDHAPGFVKGDVLKQVQAELKASPLAESEVADLFVRHARNRLRYDSSASEWMAYEDEHWVKIKEKEVLERCKEFVGKVRPKHSAHFVRGVAEMASWSLCRSQWNAHRHLIPLANGVLDLSKYASGLGREDLKTLSLRPFDPEDGLTWKLPFSFDPDADCPTIRQWLTDYTAILQEDGTWRPSKEFQDRVIASIAAALRGLGGELQFFLEVVGLPGTGKGTLFRLIQSFMGQNNVFITDLQTFEKDRFAAAGIVGKRLMQITDSDDYRDSAQKTRSITGGDPMYLDKKHVQSDGEGYFPNVVCMIAANKTIEWKDPAAMERRRVAVRFDRKIEKHNQDPKFGDKLEAELPGLLNWALSLGQEDIFRILKIDGEDSKEVRRQALEEQAMGMFVRSRLAVDLHARIKIGDLKECSPKEREALDMYYKDADALLFPAYREFYRSEYGVDSEISSKKFNQDLASFLHASLSIPPHLIFKETKRSRDGYHWRGLALRTENDERPTPFEVSPSIGDAKLLEAMQSPNKPKPPTPPNGGPKGGQPLPASAALPAPISTPAPQTELWAGDDELRAQTLLRADIDGVADFKPTKEQANIEANDKHVQTICAAVWEARSVAKAAEHLALLFRDPPAAFVGWVWMRHRLKYVYRHAPEAVRLLGLSAPKPSSMYDEEDVIC